MAKPLLRILQINTKDAGGGADHVAWSLHRGSLAQGHRSWIYVGAKTRNDPLIISANNDVCRSRWAKAWLSFGSHLTPLERKIRGIWRLRELLTHGIGQTNRWIDILNGREDFNFPATQHILDIVPEKPALIHCHNLHGSYFDLRKLPFLSRKHPLLFTLHDAWLLSGHCAHSFDCGRWKTGCGNCPDLSIYPPIRRDNTAYNWRRKSEIYSQCRLFCTTPCRWLMGKVEHSVFARAIQDARVIPYGLDLAVFRPGDKQVVRHLLGLPQKAKIVLFAANSLRKGLWKDHETMKKTIGWIGHHMREDDFCLVGLGEAPHSETMSPDRIRWIPFQTEPQKVAECYQASDIYLHPALADTFPNMVIEALACGIPVVATNVGGIPEQVVDGVTGFVVQPHQAAEMINAVQRLLSDDALRTEYGKNAVLDAAARFDAARMVSDYLQWYRDILQYWKS